MPIPRSLALTMALSTLLAARHAQPPEGLTQNHEKLAADEWRRTFGYNIDEAPHRYAANDPNVANLSLLDLTKYPDARCLDGSSGSFYVRMVPPDANGKNSTKWNFFLEGGGWCYNATDCYARRESWLGSSKMQAPQRSFTLYPREPLDCNANPLFCDSNAVFMHYCDGNSFSGDLAKPYMGSDGKQQPMWFNGRGIVDAIIKTLIAEHNLADATEVLWSGGSAGGLAIFLTMDRVHADFFSKFQKLRKYKAMSEGGYFLHALTFAGENAFPLQMKTISKLSNATLPKNCLEKFNIEERYRCNFADSVFEAGMDTEILLINSALDIYQGTNIKTSLLFSGHMRKAWWNCTYRDIDRFCTPDMLKGIRLWQAEFLEHLQANKFGKSSYYSSGSVFIDTCQMHCESTCKSCWNKLRVAGNSIFEAATEWWLHDSSANGPLNKQWLPCAVAQDPLGKKNQCNPTCGSTDTFGPTWCTKYPEQEQTVSV